MSLRQVIIRCWNGQYQANRWGCFMFQHRICLGGDRALSIDCSAVSRPPPALAEKWLPEPGFQPHPPGASKGEWTSVEGAYAFLDELARHARACVVPLGQSATGMSIKGLEIRASAQAQVRVLVQARAHGNEPAGTEGTLKLAYQLLQGDGQPIADVDILIAPC